MGMNAHKSACLGHHIEWFVDIRYWDVIGNRNDANQRPSVIKYEVPII